MKGEENQMSEAREAQRIAKALRDHRGYIGTYDEYGKPYWYTYASVAEFIERQAAQSAPKVTQEDYPDEYPGIGVTIPDILNDLRQVKKRHDRLVLDPKACATYIATIEAALSARETPKA